MSIQERAEKWYLEGYLDNRVGASSVFLCHTLTGIPTPDHPDYGPYVTTMKNSAPQITKIEPCCPQDGNDLWRCIRFIRKIPELKIILGIMILYPGWDLIIDNWDRFDTEYDPNAVNGSHLNQVFNKITG